MQRVARRALRNVRGGHWHSLLRRAGGASTLRDRSHREAVISGLGSENVAGAGGKLPTSLFGYDVLALLGEGAHSHIYAVSDPKTGQVYALKHVVRRSEKDDRFIAQAENEFKIGALFKHPNLRRSLEFKLNKTLLRRVTDAGLVMEMVDGTPMQLEPPKTLKQALDCFIQASRGLGAVHYQRYVHCDIKPGNIMMTPGGGIKIIDFGQAVKIGTEKERVQGTPDYISPEQVKRRPVTERTDIYGMGASMYWALTGRRVPTMMNVAKADRSVVVAQDFASPFQINANLPRPLSNLIMNCVRVNPLDRPANMKDLGELLEQITGELTEDVVLHP
jgi:serine/threonine-protein kinase